MSCPERAAIRAATLASLEASGWPAPEVVLDDQDGPPSMHRCNLTWRRTIERAGQARSDFVLLCEDDVIFGRWFSENLRSWPVLRELPGNGAFYGSLYNHGRGALRRESERHSVAKPEFAWGAQALVMTPRTARFLVANWEKKFVNADVRMPQLAAFLSPIYHHVPSLVDHVGRSLWGGDAHRAVDFDPNWRAL